MIAICLQSGVTNILLLLWVEGLWVEGLVHRSLFVRVRGGHGDYKGNHLKVIMEIFRTLGSRSLSVTAMLNFRVKQIHLSTASERTTRQWYL